MLGATIGRLAPSGPVLWGLVPHSAVKSRLVTSRLANIFGNDTMYGHDKNLKRAKTPEINQIYRINRVPKARTSFEVPGVPVPEEIVRRTLRKSK